MILFLCLFLVACRPRQSAELSQDSTLQSLNAPEAPFAPMKVAARDCEYGGEFRAIEALDRLTVRFTLCYSDVAFLAKIASPAFAIQPAEWLEQAGESGEILGHPVGSGPYQFRSWTPGQELVLERFDEYWGQKARLQKLIFRWNPDAEWRLRELQAGKVDAIDGVSPGDYAAIQATDELIIKPRQNLDIFYIGMNSAAPLFDNEQVRQAIAMAVDRKSIVEKYFPLYSAVADYFSPCEIPWTCQGDSWYSYDPGRARALLVEAGFPNGFAAQLAYRDVARSYLPQPYAVAKEIQAQLQANLGVTLELVGMESDVFLASMDAGTLKGLYLMGLSANYPDPSYLLDFHFGSGASLQFGSASPELAKLLKAGSAIADGIVRQAIYREVNTWIRQHVPVIPVAHSASLILYQSSVQNAHASPMNTETFAIMENGKNAFTWMEAQEPFSLYCADETDASAQRVCAQVTESLYRYSLASAAVEPGLASQCTASPDLKEWICNLRSGIIFHDGSSLDANDVVTSFKAQWISDDPLHRGRTGEFIPFTSFFGNFLPGWAVQDNY